MEFQVDHRHDAETKQTYHEKTGFDKSKTINLRNVHVTLLTVVKIERLLCGPLGHCSQMFLSHRTHKVFLHIICSLNNMTNLITSTELKIQQEGLSE
jgi:hypothetical protein